MLKELHLVRFRAFTDFSVSFREGAVLVGPNNAGKSTILTALRLADVLLRTAQRRSPSETRRDGDRYAPAWPLVLNEFPSLRESVRHEFHNEEARLELTWKSGARLVAVWPNDVHDEADPFFYLETRPGMYVRNVKQAREDFTSLGVIPVLSPIDHDEKLLTSSYVRLNVSGRLSSRHFRNNLRLLKADNDLESFVEFARPWLDGITLEDVTDHLGDGDLSLDVYYRERDSRIPKELFWAGDGIQVWLQILFHVFRTRSAPTLILDEPEVYLHPDLQRRLVHLLEESGRQVIVATHSAEFVAESRPELLTTVDRGKRHARRAKSERELETLSKTLGTAFNLRLARALRSRVVLFVEGRDMAMLRSLARTLGCENIAAEREITVIRLEGYSRSDRVTPFVWLAGELLPEAITTHVLLDRDYRSDSSVQSTEAEFAKHSISCHVWRRKELESYLLNPDVLARISGAPRSVIDTHIDHIVDGMSNAVFARMLDERTREERSAGRHGVDITEACHADFSAAWQSRDYRLSVVPPKDVLSELNSRLAADGHRTVTARALARAHTLAEIPDELKGVLLRVERDVRS